MAQIDFSNAIINLSPDLGGNAKPLAAPYFGTSSNAYLYWRETPSAGYTNVSQATMQRLESSNSKLSYLVTGTITTEGLSNLTWFELWSQFWRVSNIRYSSGDTYSFQVDFDITVS